jgi:alpha-glucosidase
MAENWWRDAVVYQIYPRSFADADGDGIGDLAGITGRLEHVAGLGAEAVWLTPFQRSPQADHGYDVSDYCDVDPLFGDLGDFDALLDRAHELHLRVIVDLVPNHCSVEHPLFRAALAAGRGSPERARFHFADGHGDAPPNNWSSMFGGSAWTRVADGQWYLHLYAPEQPDWNWRDPRTPAFFDDVLRFWYDRGVDGLRIDVAHGLFKADGLPDLPDPAVLEPMRLRANTLACDQDEVHEVYRRWRKIADSYEVPRALIGEVNLDPDRAARYVRPDELHQAFAFAFLSAPWDADAWHRAGDALLAHARGTAPVTWVTENHDVVRSPTRYGSTARAAAGLLTILALPGAAYLYQGQELGLPEVDVPPAARQDPAWARSGNSRDGCRVPLPWQRDPAGTYGFSPPGAAPPGAAPPGAAPPGAAPPDARPPWLPVPDGWGEYVDSPMLGLCRSALALRRGLHDQGVLSADDEVAWTVDEDRRLLAIRGRLTLTVAMGATAVPLPSGTPVLTSGPLTDDGRLPPDTAAWVLR